MSLGIIEVITLLLGLSGFSVANNPKAPSAQQALEYAVADADLVAHLDAASVVPGNYKVLASLQNQPQIRANPELAKAVRKAVAEIDGPRGLVKSTIGVDVTTDVSDATAFVRFVPKQPPNIVVAVHGNFKVDTIDKIAKLTGKGAVKDASGAWVDTGDGHAVALTKSGVLLAGTSALVKERLQPSWQKPALTPGTNLGHVAEVIDARPVFAVFVMMSQAARNELLANMQGQGFASDVIKRHKLASFAIYHDGIGWSWFDSTKAGLDSIAQVSDGAIELLRAAHFAPRGFAKIVMGVLESYRGTSKEVDLVLARKADIHRIVESYTGDGNFNVQVEQDPAKLRLRVRLAGKSLSEVLPLVLVLAPPATTEFLKQVKSAPPPSQIAVPPPPGPPATKPAPLQAPPKATPPKGGPPKRP